MEEQKKGPETKPIKRLKDLLTTGNIWLYALSTMKGGKVYAYTLAEEIEKEFYFKPSRVMIYLVLYRLEAEGLIKSEFEQRRKYYTLTDKGRKTMAEAKDYLLLLSKKL
jgi:DNA-binding PadR family transcriptional regulator